jgi:peptidoglycan/LPS O-acetylase OafA/YrhL
VSTDRFDSRPPESIPPSVLWRIPCLDGLRAISIALVLFSHVAEKIPALAGRSHVDLGNFGVRVFFVISGYLITTLLLEERARSGAISLAHFYVRRAFRIFPAFYAFIAVVVAAALFGAVELREHDLRAAITYTMNYHPDRGWTLGHLWSLSVEEQFYLAWPLVVATARRRTALRVALAVIVVAPLIRVLYAKVVPSHLALVGESFETVADTLASGCALALLRDRFTEIPLLAKVQSHALAPLGFGALAMLAHAQHDRIAFSFTLGETITNTMIALAIDSCLRTSTSLFGRLLESRPFTFVGQLSYSLYLWQQPFLARDHESWTTSFPQSLVLIAAGALASYYLVEKPMLTMRRRAERSGPVARFLRFVASRRVAPADSVAK